MFWFRCLAVLDLPGAVFFVGMERGTPEEGGIGPGVDGVVDAVEVLWGGCGRGTPEEGGIGPGCCGGGVITTWAAGDGVIATGSAV